MTATNVDWSRIIPKMTDENCGIPTDVTFQIVGKRGQKRRLQEVKAHKMLLAMVSPTLKTMFYSTNVGNKTANVLKIENTTAPAFQIIIGAVYNTKSIEASLKGKSVDEVFDVVKLIKRYQIKDLMKATKEYLASYPINDATVLEVAGDAMEYIKLFEDEAEQLLITCAKFLQSKLKDLDAVSRYAREHQDRGEVFAALLARMNTQCPNCKKKICQDGETVKSEEFSEGLVVTNYDCGKKSKVTKVEADNVTVTSIKPRVNQNGVKGPKFGNIYFKYSPNNRPNFLFCCN